MKLDFFTSNGMVYRWSLVDGYPRCVEDALDPKAAGALPALQARAAIEVMTDAAEAYEAAQTIIARGEPDNGAPRQIPDPAAVRPEDAPEDWAAPLVQNPAWALLPRTIEAIGLGGEDGQETTAPEPRWQAFDAASAIVAAASPTTLALARWRAGEPSQTDADAHAAWVQAKADALAALETEAAKPLVVDPRPVPRVISRRQFAMACVALALMTPTEAMAFVTTNTIPALLAAAIATLPANMQFAVQLSVAGSMTFERSNPATVALMDRVTVPTGFASAAALRDAIWRLGATFP